MARLAWLAGSLLLLALAAADAQSTMDAGVMAPGMDMDMGAMAPMDGVPAPAPSEDAAAEESTDYADYAPPYYPPKPSAGTWFSWLPEDPILLAGVIISFLSAIGFLFVIWTVFFELILGPFFMTFVDAFSQHKHKH